MNDVNNGGPAFPFEYHNQTSRLQPGFFGTGDVSPGGSQQFAGMSLRDHFAGLAMQGDIAGLSRHLHQYDGKELQTKAIAAYQMADAMLEARK